MKNYSGSSTPNNYQYTGQQFDDEIDLYSLRARYYDPGNGRFLSRDEAGIVIDNPIELNRYVYTANNPTTFVDPSGYGIVDTISTYITQGVAAITSSPLVANISLQALIWAMGKSAIAAILGYFAAITIHNVRTGDDKKMVPKELAASIILGLAIGSLSYFASKVIYIGYVMHGFRLAQTLLRAGVAGFMLSILSWYLGIIIRQSEKLGVEGYEARNITLYSLFVGLIAWTITTGVAVQGSIVSAAKELKRLFGPVDILIIAVLTAMNTLRRLESL